MAIVEYSTPVTHRSLMNKSKDDLALLVRDLLGQVENLHGDCKKMKAALKSMHADPMSGYTTLMEILTEMGVKYDEETGN